MASNFPRVFHLATSVLDERPLSFGLTLIGFANAFELLVLAVSTARRGKSDILVGAVVGSFAYNSTVIRVASALARPLNFVSTTQLHLPLVTMVAALALILVIGLRQGRLGWRYRHRPPRCLLRMGGSYCHLTEHRLQHRG